MDNSSENDIQTSDTCKIITWNVSGTSVIIHDQRSTDDDDDDDAFDDDTFDNDASMMTLLMVMTMYDDDDDDGNNNNKLDFDSINFLQKVDLFYRLLTPTTFWRPSTGSEKSFPRK